MKKNKQSEEEKLEALLTKKYKILSQQIKQTEEELERLYRGYHPGFVNGVKKLHNQQEERLLQNEESKEIELQKLKVDHENEIASIKDNYSSEFTSLEEQMVKTLHDKCKTLRTQKGIITPPPTEPSQDLVRKSKRKRGENPEVEADDGYLVTKKKSLVPEPIQYSLRVSEIWQDMKFFERTWEKS